MAHLALYAGSFDPITNGHLDVIRASLNLVDQLVVAIGIHHAKAPFFTFEERARLIKAALADHCADLVDKIEIVAFDHLLVDKARDVGGRLLIRGLRDGTDFDYEMQMATVNRTIAPDIQTVFVPANAQTRTISATLIRQIAAMGGDITPFVPKIVAQAMSQKRLAEKKQQNTGRHF